jgi:hypothetical protein
VVDTAWQYMLETEGWDGMNRQKHFKNPTKFKFHISGRQRQIVITSAFELGCGEENALEELMLSSFLKYLAFIYSKKNFRMGI